MFNLKRSPYACEVVITGLGIVSPIGIGRDQFWGSLIAGRSGIDRISAFDPAGLPVSIAGEVRNFDPKDYVKPRKNLKVMSRDAQFAVASVDLACQDARLDTTQLDPDRFGVVYAADRIRNDLSEVALPYRACLVDGRFDHALWGTAGLEASYPLIMLKNLPNMLASHISIAKDARGPNNTVCNAEASSLLAIGEAASVIARGAADVMITGGAASRLHPIDLVRGVMAERLTRRGADPAHACRPFDLDRDGQVRGEGAAAFILESRQHAERRGAPILARLTGAGSAFGSPTAGHARVAGGIIRAIEQALRQANLPPAALSHVNAHGLSTIEEDCREAQALAKVLPEIPVFAPKSYFGNLGAASGAVELAASVLSLVHAQSPATLNYDRPDPECPVAVIREPHESRKPAAIIVNQTAGGQAAAALIAAP